MTRPQGDRPNTLWPIGSKVTVTDAHGLDAIDGKRIPCSSPNPVWILVEAPNGLRRFSHTDWIITEPPAEKIGFDDDLLGLDEEPEFEELL